jgi:hypothetical protein
LAAPAALTPPRDEERRLRDDARCLEVWRERDFFPDRDRRCERDFLRDLDFTRVLLRERDYLREGERLFFEWDFRRDFPLDRDRDFRRDLPLERDRDLRRDLLLERDRRFRLERERREFFLERDLAFDSLDLAWAFLDTDLSTLPKLLKKPPTSKSLRDLAVLPLNSRSSSSLLAIVLSAVSPVTSESCLHSFRTARTNGKLSEFLDPLRLRANPLSCFLTVLTTVLAAFLFAAFCSVRRLRRSSLL